MLRNLISLIALVGSFSALATTYYISPTGNDANSGTSQAQAWKTIARLNQAAFTFQPGDQILFQRGGKYPGEIFFGSSGTSTSPITLGAYGSGGSPIISGGGLVTGWVQHSGNIWKAPVQNEVRFLYSNDQLMTLARFPNTGWLRNDQGSTTQLNDAALTQPSGYWNGAKAVIRSSNWSYDIAPITNYVTGQLNFAPISVGLQDYEWGYYMTNKLEELDMPGEWYHDVTAGMLYFMAPNNADPNSLTIEYPLEDYGIWTLQQYLVVDGLKFMFQKQKGVFLDDADNVTVRNCEFADLYQAVFAYGDGHTIENCDIQHTYASSIHMIGNNNTVHHNSIHDVCLQPGMGETGWGYMGMRMNGDDMHIYNNTLNTIGYIGIAIEGNGVVERNYVDNALALLNDGCGIGFDYCTDLVVKDNIIVNIEGQLESSAPDWLAYEHIGHGLYFGWIEVQNTIVQNNTVANCKGSGIHVDHTMLSNGNQVIDNVFFNNNVQISLSDFSNFHGPGAVAPYFVPQYNDTYSGNVFYSVKAEQLCMLQLQVYTPGWSDWGTFSNNYYHNPYNESSILMEDHSSGVHHRYTLERWQNDHNEDLNSHASDLHLEHYDVTNVLANLAIPNANFDYNINSWTGWPNDGQMTHDYTYLDQGALKVHFATNATYPTFHHYHTPDVPMVSGQWYEVKFSTQSNVIGEMRVQIKGNSQLPIPDAIFDTYVPFSPTRRDERFLFQADLTDQAHFSFINSYTETTYWLDNIELNKVNVTPVDPFDMHQLLYNPQVTSQTYSISGCWADVMGNTYDGSVTLAPFESVVLIKVDDIECGLSTAVDDTEVASNDKGWNVFPNPVSIGGSLDLGQIDERSEIQVYDLNGRLVWTEQVIPGRMALSIDMKFSPGSYLLRLIGAESERKARFQVI